MPEAGTIYSPVDGTVEGVTDSRHAYSIRSDDGLDVLWYSAPDGVLTTFDGKRMLIAIPADTPNLPRGAETVLREIDGRPYLIFPR